MAYIVFCSYKPTHSGTKFVKVNAFRLKLNGFTAKTFLIFLFRRFCVILLTRSISAISNIFYQIKNN